MDIMLEMNIMFEMHWIVQYIYMVGIALDKTVTLNR